MKRKKVLAMLLCVGLTAAALSGCSQETGNAPAEQEGQETEAPEEEEPGEPEGTEEADNAGGSEEAEAPEEGGQPEAEEPEAGAYSDVPVKEAGAADDVEAMFEAEVYNYKIIQNIPVAYSDYGQWASYCQLGANLLNMNVEELGDQDAEMIASVKGMREGLKQVKSYEDCVWYIWGDQMPSAESVDGLEFTLANEDNEDFKPFLVPYMLGNQDEVIGNMIVIAGGGYNSRNNEKEGYPIAEEFNERGYNCFVLQRRVEPYSDKDVWMDMQRSIRYLRHYGEEKGIGALECIAAAGFSGGSGTILGAVAYLYGDVQPSVYDSAYTSDAVDAESGDLDVALCIYGPAYEGDKENFNGLVTENPNLPAVFLAAGTDDPMETAADNIKLYNSVYGKTIVELHNYSLNPHGFGVGVAGTTSVDWMDQASTFVISMKLNRGDDTAELAEKAEFGVFPEKYTRSQTYTVEMPFGPTEVQAGLNDEGTSILIFMEAFGDQITLAGLVDYDGNVIPKYDSVGFFAGDMQNLYDSADPNSWNPIQ